MLFFQSISTHHEQSGPVDKEGKPVYDCRIPDSDEVAFDKAMEVFSRICPHDCTEVFIDSETERMYINGVNRDGKFVRYFLTPELARK